MPMALAERTLRGEHLKDESFTFQPIIEAVHAGKLSERWRTEQSGASMTSPAHFQGLFP